MNTTYPFANTFNTFNPFVNTFNPFVFNTTGGYNGFAGFNGTNGFNTFNPAGIFNGAWGGNLFNTLSSFNPINTFTGYGNFQNGWFPMNQYAAAPWTTASIPGYNSAWDTTGAYGVSPVNTFAQYSTTAPFAYGVTPFTGWTNTPWQTWGGYTNGFINPINFTNPTNFINPASFINASTSNPSQAYAQATFPFAGFSPVAQPWNGQANFPFGAYQGQTRGNTVGQPASQSYNSTGYSAARDAA